MRGGHKEIVETLVDYPETIPDTWAPLSILFSSNVENLDILQILLEAYLGLPEERRIDRSVTTGIRNTKHEGAINLLSRYEDRLNLPNRKPHQSP